MSKQGRKKTKHKIFWKSVAIKLSLLYPSKAAQQFVHPMTGDCTYWSPLFLFHWFPLKQFDDMLTSVSCGNIQTGPLLRILRHRIKP